MAKRKFRIGQYVSVKGLEKSCGKVTFIRDDDDFIKYRVKDNQSDITKFWNEKSLRKITKNGCIKKTR